MTASILTRFGNWLAGNKTAGSVRAGMDLTKTTSENQRHWRDADALSGRAAYPKTERKVARERSRLEAENNSWYRGMLRTAANHIVGTGPRLQVLTSDPEVNARIERSWSKWCKAVGLVDKLHVAVQTYWRDGEVFALRTTRPSLYPVTLDVRLYEGDQVAQPYWHILDPSLEDGKRVDALGNAVEYWIYDHHPGDLNIGHVNLLSGQWFEADDVIHLFRAERPGQLRGIPRCAPAIDWLAHMRRFSKATLSAAEAAALWGVFVSTNSSAVAPAQMPADFLSVDWERNVVNFMPEGWEPKQLRSDHPATTNEMYQRSELTYFCRCANMPYSLAAGTSRDSNFASAKMDIKNTWEPEVLSEQSRVESLFLAPVFRWFLESAVLAPGVLDGAPLIADIDYQFVWPPLPQSDEVDSANAAMLRLQSGLSTLSLEHRRAGLDHESTMKAIADDCGATVEECQRALAQKLIGLSPVQQPADRAAAANQPFEEAAA